MSRTDQIEALRTEVIKLLDRVQILETEKIKELEEENKKLAERIDFLETKKSERFVTVKELAEIMSCSTNSVHTKIRDGVIFATRKVGDQRIPMNQFYDKEPIDLLKRKSNRKVSEHDNMKKLIFGNGGT